jgi:uncharacterized damage-inducible protein DinB
VSEEALPERRYGWWDMWAAPEDDPRNHEVRFTNERDTLVGYLRDYRLTLQMKCDGLDAAGMAARSVPPSTLSLLGLVRHMADVELHWFRRVLAGEEAAWRFRLEEDREAAFNGAVADDAVVDAAWAAWREEVAFAVGFVEAAPDLEIGGPHGGGVITLREVLVHMLEEYARHAGHADLIRERIDGRVGQ